MDAACSEQLNEKVTCPESRLHGQVTRTAFLVSDGQRPLFAQVSCFTQNHKAFVRETQLSELSFARELRLAVDQPGDDRKQKAHRDTAHQDADDALKGR